jgi:hypothetical protein
MSPWHLWPQITRQAATTGGCERSPPESSRAAIALLQRPVAQPLEAIERVRPQVGGVVHAQQGLRRGLGRR